MLTRIEQFVMSSTYLKKKDPNANGVELTIIVKDKTGVEKIVDELFNSKDRWVFARVKDNEIKIIEHNLNSAYLLNKINKLLYRLDGNIKDRYFRKIKNKIFTEGMAFNILEDALKELDKNSNAYNLVLENYNKIKTRLEKEKKLEKTNN